MLLLFNFDFFIIIIYIFFFLFLDPRRTMYHSNVSVRLSEVDKLVTSILYVNA